MPKSFMPENAFEMFQDMCDDFSLERNNQIIHDAVKGFFCGKDYPDCIQVLGNYNIIESDWLVHNNTGRRYFIDKITPIAETDYRLHYQTEFEYNNSKQSNIQYSIGTIQGSAIIGNQQNAIINICNSLDDIQKAIINDVSIDAIDKEELNKLVSRLKIIMEDNQPVSKGTLAKFSDLLAKHSNVAIAIGGAIISWLSGK